MARRPTTGSRGGLEPLGHLLSQAHRTAARRAGVALDRETWREVAGDRIAQRSAPGALDGGVRRVPVTAAVWAQELSFLAEDIAKKLRLRGFSVTSIRFRAGTVESPAPREPPRQIPSPIELSEDAEQRLAKVDDPALREVIADAMAQSLANQALEPTAPIRRKPSARDPRSAGQESARSDRGGSKPPATPPGTREED